MDTVKDMQRFDQIIHVLFKHDAGFWIDILRLKDRLTLPQRLDKRKFEPRKIAPTTLRMICEELGGGFVKFAQFLSVRPDIVAPDYLRELERLQDSVPPFPGKQARQIVEQELGAPISDNFLSFEEQPLASASIAQAHKAVLRTGETVVVKIQRPNIENIMKRDIDLFRAFIHLMSTHNIALKGINLDNIINEFERWTLLELDFEQETLNTQIIKGNLAKDPHVKIPATYPKLCTKQIIVMEYLPGSDIRNVAKLKEKGYALDKLIKIWFDTMLHQVFIDGVFHADPHPGNIIVINGSTIGIIDFGIVGRFTPLLRDQTARLFAGLVSNDALLIAETLQEMGMEGDSEIIRVEIEQILVPLKNIEIQDIIVRDVFGQVLAAVRKHSFKVPLDFILFAKAIMTLEGVALTYDPHFRLAVHAKPFVKKLLRARSDPRAIAAHLTKTAHALKNFASTIPDKTAQLFSQVKDTQQNLKYIDHDLRDLMGELDKSSNRVTMGLIIVGLIIAATFTLPYDQITIYGISAFSFVGFTLTGLLVLFVMLSIFREKKI